MKKLTQYLGAKAFFAVVFLNAFVDLGHKILIQNTLFKLYDGPEQVIFTACLNALILMPFILLLAPAGYISDHFNKVSVMRRSAWFVVLCTSIISVSYYLGLFSLAFAMTFLLAAQSAIYSPAKFGVLKTLFGKSRLGEANGLASSLSIIAILGGIFCYSVAFEALYDASASTEAEVLRAIAPAGLILFITSLLELLLCYQIPTAAAERALADARAQSASEGESPSSTPLSAPSSSKLRFADMFSRQAILDCVHPLIHKRQIRLAVIGLSTFWAVGQVMLAAFPAFIKTQTGLENTVAIQGVLACSGIGIAIGSFIAGRLSRDHIELGLLPFATLGLAAGLWWLPNVESLSAAAAAFLLVGVSGGLFTVPLNALIQFQTDDQHLGKTLAANNWLQNITMLAFLILTASFAFYGLSAQVLLKIIAVVALIGSVYTLVQLPRAFVRLAVSILLRRHYRLAVQGLRNIPSEGGALLLGNHISWIDWAIIQIAVPRPVRFVMINSIYQRWYLRWLFKAFRCIPISQGAASRAALDTVAECLNNGDVVCLFPEGTISRTGHLANFRKGFERCCEKVDASVPIVPFYLHGLWGSQFSRAGEELNRLEKNGSKRDIVVSFGPCLDKTISAVALKQKVHELSICAWQQAIEATPSLGEQWIHSAKTASKHTFIADGEAEAISPVKALSGSVLMASYLKPHLVSQNIGVLLPSSSAGALANMALLMQGKTLVNMNYSAPLASLSSALESAKVETIISSRKFVKRLSGKGMDLTTLFEGRQVVYLEDFRDGLSAWKKPAVFLLCKLLPASWLCRIFCQTVSTDSTAAIQFSSGSEGLPKGVCLSHQNISANVKQTGAVLNSDANEVIMANLPLFHAFGLTATMFLPLLQGISVVFHPDPTDAFGGARAIARHQATLLFGTSTFLRLFIRNKKIHPLMLSSLRLVVAGAERLRPEIRQGFSEKFHRPIFEGYGATETSPVISVNMPDKMGARDLKVQHGQKLGSVGMPLPGTSVRVVDPDSLEPLPAGESGLLIVAGVQVMQGYLNDIEKTQSVIIEQDAMRWYSTGDKGYLDDDGFVFIQDRYSRFAKIGGEMVSLGLVEQAIRQVLAKHMEEQDLPDVFACNLPHPSKGEQVVVLITEDFSRLLTPEELAAAGLSSLAMPSKVHIVDHLPTLISGKLDMQSAKTMAQALTTK